MDTLLDSMVVDLDGEDGASAVEYSLIVVAVAALIVVVVFALGKFTGETFADTCASLDSASTITAATDCP